MCIFLALNYLTQRATQDCVKKKKFLSYFTEVHLPLRKPSNTEDLPPVQPPSSVTHCSFSLTDICGGLSMYQTLSTVLGHKKSLASFLTFGRHPPSGGLAITQREKRCHCDIDSMQGRGGTSCLSGEKESEGRKGKGFKQEELSELYGSKRTRSVLCVCV